MTFQQAIDMLQHTWPNVPVGATARAGQYYERAVKITDYERRNDSHFVGHGVNGKEMWVYYSEVKGVICCGDKDT